MGRVYAVVSAKGGVGKTTTAANLAAALAAADSRVAVVDGDLGMANLASALGVEIGEVTLHDVLAGDSDVAAAIHEGPHGLSVVPGSPALDAFSRADPERLEGVLADLAAEHDYVILDTGAGLSNDTVAPLTYVDEVLLVSTPTRDALGDTDKTRRVAERLGTTVAGAALLRADASAAESEVVVETLDTGILGTVPDSEEIRRAAEAGEPLTLFAPESGAAAAFASLAAALTGEEVFASTAEDAAGDAAGSDDVSNGEDDEDGDEAADDGEDEEEPTDETGDEEDEGPAEEEPDGETSDEEPDEDTTAEADVADPNSDSEVDSGDPIVEAVDDDSDSPVEPADPEVVAVAGDAADDGDEGVYSTPLEEVPIDEAEAAESDGSDDSGDPDDDVDVEEAESTPDDADDETDSDGDDGDENEDADDGTDSDSDGSDPDDGDDEEDDDSGSGGFFSRFFG